MVDEAFGYSSGPRGTYRVRVNNTIEAHAWIEVEASSKEDAERDALIAARAKPLHEWLFDEDDMIVEDVELPDDGPDPRRRTATARARAWESTSATDEAESLATDLWRVPSRQRQGAPRRNGA